MRDFINIGGRDYRVELNFNAVVAYLQEKGDDSFGALAGFGELRPSDMTMLLAAGINEGERLEGRESALTSKEVGAMIGLDIGKINEFVQIYVRQMNPAAPAEGKKKE